MTVSKCLLTKCATFSLSVYKTGINLGEFLPSWETLHTPKVLNCFFEGLKTGIILRDLFTLKENIAPSQGVQYFLCQTSRCAF